MSLSSSDALDRASVAPGDRCTNIRFSLLLTSLGRPGCHFKASEAGAEKHAYQAETTDVVTGTTGSSFKRLSFTTAKS